MIARIKLCGKWELAEAMVLATARQEGARVVTGDSGFRGKKALCCCPERKV